MAKPRVAIIGLGIMGSGMDGRVLSADFPLAVYNRNPDKSGPFGSAGATVAASSREAASDADIIISMVSDELRLGGVAWRKRRASGAPRGSVLIECSPLTVGWVKELAAAAASKVRRKKIRNTPAGNQSKSQPQSEHFATAGLPQGIPVSLSLDTYSIWQNWLPWNMRFVLASCPHS